MGRKLNLSHLSDEECEQILKVIQRDFDLRQQEKGRLAKIQEEIQEDLQRTDMLAKNKMFSDRYCVRCFDKFTFLINPRIQCAGCEHNVCKKCAPYNEVLKKNVCAICVKRSGLVKQSNSWFYTNVRDRFKRFGGAKIVRSLHSSRRPSICSDAESDGGYQASLVSAPETTDVFTDAPSRSGDESDEKDEVSDIIKYKKKLEVIARTIRRNCQANDSDSSSTTSEKHQGTLATSQHVRSVRMLLTTLAVNIGNDMSENFSHSDQSNDLFLHVLRERVRQICNLAFGGDLLLEQQLLAADVSNVDDFIALTSELLVTKICKDAQDRDTENGDFVDNDVSRINAMNGKYPDGYPLHASEVLANRTRYGRSYSGFLPSLLQSDDTDSDAEILSKHSAKNDNGSQWIMSKPTLALKRRIPYSAHDGYRPPKPVSDDEEQPGPLFLPPISNMSEGPTIGERYASEISDDSETVHDDEDETDERRLSSALTDSGVQTDGSPPRTKAHGPWFIRPPCDVTVTCGGILHCECVVGGTFPIDVFWYQDVRQLDDDAGVRCSISQNSSGLSTMTLSSITLEDGGTYVCVCVGTQATCRETFQVTVVDPMAEVACESHGQYASVDFNGNDDLMSCDSDESLQQANRLNAEQTSFGAKRMKLLSDTFTAELDNVQKVEQLPVGSSPTSQENGHKVHEHEMVTRAPEKREAFTHHRSVFDDDSFDVLMNTSLEDDSKNVSVDEFEEIFEANSPAESLGMAKPRAETPVDEESERFVNCGPKRIKADRYRRDYVIQGNTSTSQTTTSRPVATTTQISISSVHSADSHDDVQSGEDEYVNSGSGWVSPKGELETLPLPSVKGLKEKFAALESEEGGGAFTRVSSLTGRQPPVSVLLRRQKILKQMGEEKSDAKPQNSLPTDVVITEQNFAHGDSLIRPRKPPVIQVTPPTLPPSRATSAATSPTTSRRTSVSSPVYQKIQSP